MRELYWGNYKATEKSQLGFQEIRNNDIKAIIIAIKREYYT